AQHGGHVKHVRDAVALEHVGEAFRPGHSSIVSKQHDDRPRIRRSSCPGLSRASTSSGDAKKDVDGRVKPGHDGGNIVPSSLHLIASGLVGEPTAPVIGMAGATNMNS